jgi:hypothetical protein
VVDKTQTGILPYCGDAKDTNALAGTNRPTEPKHADGGIVTWKPGPAWPPLHVYFITDGIAIKIGKSVSPAVRMDQLQGAHHTELTLIAAFPAGTDDEEFLHRHLANHRIRGEWFRPSHDIDFIIGQLKAAKDRLAAGETIADVVNNPMPAPSATGRIPKPIASREAFKAWLREHKIAEPAKSEIVPLLLSNLRFNTDSQVMRDLNAADFAAVKAAARANDFNGVGSDRVGSQNGEL